MTKLAIGSAVIIIFLIIPGSILAAQDFDYFFGSLFVPTQNIINSTVVSTISTVSAQNTTIATPSQILAMQANLNQIKANLATLNSSLAKSNSNKAVVAKESPKIVVAHGIPLLLDEKEKTEKSTLSIFASLIPPDVKNFPLITTYLVVITLALLGIIVYLFFTRRQEKKRVI